MEGLDYAERVAMARQSEEVEQAVDEIDFEVSGFEIEPEIDKEVEVEQVDVPDESEVATQKFDDQDRQYENEELSRMDYVERVAYARELERKTADPSRTRSAENVKKAEKIAQIAKKVEKINDLMRERGVSRRYCLSKADVPSSAQLFSGQKDLQYYYKFDDEFRPSDVADRAGVEHWVKIDEDERVVETVRLLSEEYRFAVDDVVGKDEETARNLIGRLLVTKLDEPRGEDRFDPGFVETIAETLSQTQNN